MKHRMIICKLLVLIIFLVMLFSHHPFEQESVLDISLELCGGCLLTIGGIGRIWASAYILGKKNTTLIDYGPYSMVRNPLYFFSFLAYVGAGLAFESVSAALALSLVFFATHWGTIIAEEKRLLATFGQSFSDYRHKVPMFIPNPWIYTNKPEISLNSALFTRAMVECSLIIGVFGLAHLVEWAHLHSVIPVLWWLP